MNVRESLAGHRLIVDASAATKLPQYEQTDVYELRYNIIV